MPDVWVSRREDGTIWRICRVAQNETLGGWLPRDHADVAAFLARQTSPGSTNSLRARVESLEARIAQLEKL